MDEGGCIGIVIVIGLIIAAVVAIIQVIIYAAGAVAAVAGAIGVVTGLVMTIISFVKASKTVREERKKLGICRNTETQNIFLSTVNKSDLIYETTARKNYFLGPCFEDVNKISKYTFKNLFSLKVGFGKGDNWFGKIFFFIKALFTAIGRSVFGSIITFSLCALLHVGSFVLALVVAIFFIIGLIVETIKYNKKHISFRCPNDKKESKIPYYLCPVCGIKHKNMKPGPYGIFHRKCVCGATLPLTTSGKGYVWEQDISTNKRVKKEIHFNDLRQMCPFCGMVYNAVNSRPISIAIIGGQAAGKTTFKVAFINDFIGEETIKYGIDVKFPSPELETEYQMCLKQYKGAPIRGTNAGSSADVNTFSFELLNKKFSANRMIQLYDLPGEIFRTGEATEGWNHYTFSEGAVFVIDPYSITKVKEQNSEEVSKSSMVNCTFAMDEMMEALISTLKQVSTKKKKGKFAIPIALTINKADSMLLKKMIGDEAVKALMAAEPDKFSDYYETMDYACRCFLNSYGCANFITALDNNFEYVHFFSSSPMGAVPRGTVSRFYPINVLPIMQWLMLRADKELNKVWTPAEIVKDVEDDKRSMYITDKGIYENVILNKIEFNNKGETL